MDQYLAGDVVVGPAVFVPFDRLVAVGPVNLPVTRLFVEEIILECRKNHITRVDILGFEFEMGLFPNVLDEARTKGIDIVFHECAPGRRKLAVKVVDIFGNDTMTIVEVNVGGNR